MLDVSSEGFYSYAYKNDLTYKFEKSKVIKSL